MSTAKITVTSRRRDRLTGQRDTCSPTSAKGEQPRAGPVTTHPDRSSMLDPVLAEPAKVIDLADAQHVRRALRRKPQSYQILSLKFGEEERPVRSGDCRTSARNAIDHRFASWMAVLRAFAGSRPRNENRALRLVRERLIKTWTARGRYQPDTRLHAWFFTILRNTFLSEMRRHRASGRFSAQVAASRNDDPTVTLSQFVSALATLPDEQREALILVGGAGYSQEEAAIACDCAIGTLKDRLCRARARIAERLYSRRKDKAPGFITFLTAS